MKSTTTWLFSLLFAVLLSACSDPHYNGEQYTAFESMDELTQQIVKSLQTEDLDLLLSLLDNQALLSDLIMNSKTENAQKIKAHLQSPQGKRAMSVERIAQKQRLFAFFSAALPKQLAGEAASLKNTGVELAGNEPYEEGSPASKQAYSLRLTDDTGQSYTYDFTVIYWNGYYHLVETAAFLNPI